MAFEHYILSDGKRLRCGYTTGTCAALAAKAAARQLLSGEISCEETVMTPKGIAVTAEILEPAAMTDSARCAVRKDGGDDVDATHGALIYVTVTKTAAGLTVDGGEGVGRVTKPGLDQSVGAAAINTVPRQMITASLSEVASEYGYNGGLRAVVEVPAGTEIAKKTFNPMLGITGGISILGTSGIVSPMSLQALLNTVAVEIKVQAAQGREDLILTPGNYGADFLKHYPGLAAHPQVKCANFIGDSLDLACQYGMKTVLLVGHIGKLVKLAGGIMNTHSRVADCRTELFALHGALCGADEDTVRSLYEAKTSDGCLDILETAGLLQPVLKSLCDAAQHHLSRRAGQMAAGLVLFSSQRGLLAVSQEAEAILKAWRQSL